MKGFQSCTRNFWNNRRREDATCSSDHKVEEEAFNKRKNIGILYLF